MRLEDGADEEDGADLGEEAGQEVVAVVVVVDEEPQEGGGSSSKARPRKTYSPGRNRNPGSCKRISGSACLFVPIFGETPDCTVYGDFQLSLAGSLYGPFNSP